MAALQQADSFAPRVLLMDEVEKLFETRIGRIETAAERKA
jgi:hypothetical protein